MEFIGESPLVIHNAGFDMRFINAELQRLGFAPLPMERAIDTVMMARKKFPGSPASLDALCKRFNIDNSARTLHGALLDAQLLAEVYLELLGGRQAGLVLETEVEISADLITASSPAASGKSIRPPRPHAALPEELELHAAFVAKLKNAVWLQ
jgi:DNA polymerase-3 subunit epsilon